MVGGAPPPPLQAGHQPLLCPYSLHTSGLCFPVCVRHRPSLGIRSKPGLLFCISTTLRLALVEVFKIEGGRLQDATAKECGLHSGNIVQSAAEQAEGELRDLWPSPSPVEALDHDQLDRLVSGARDKDTLVVLYAPWCPYSQVAPCLA